MKRFLCGVVILFMLMLSLAGCANTPPSRIGTEGETSALLEKRYTFETAFAASDMVAHVRVGNWLSETTHITYYEATIINCYKGEKIENITLIQDGCSRFTMRGYPLFTAGNELLLFMKSSSSVDPEHIYIEYTDEFWIIGSFTTMLDAAESDSGEVYYMDRYGLLGETVNIDTNYRLQAPLFNEIYGNAVAKDPILSRFEKQYSFPYVFSKADIEALINSL